MKQYKTAAPAVPKRTQNSKTVQELTDQLQQIIGKNPDHAAKVIQDWVKDLQQPKKKSA